MTTVSTWLIIDPPVPLREDMHHRPLHLLSLSLAFVIGLINPFGGALATAAKAAFCATEYQVRLGLRRP